MAWAATVAVLAVAALPSTAVAHAPTIRQAKHVIRSYFRSDDADPLSGFRQRLGRCRRGRHAVVCRFSARERETGTLCRGRISVFFFDHDASPPVEFDFEEHFDRCR